MREKPGYFGKPADTNWQAGEISSPLSWQHLCTVYITNFFLRQCKVLSEKLTTVSELGRKIYYSSRASLSAPFKRIIFAIYVIPIAPFFVFGSELVRIVKKPLRSAQHIKRKLIISLKLSKVNFFFEAPRDPRFCRELHYVR